MGIIKSITSIASPTDLRPPHLSQIQNHQFLSPITPT